MLRLFKFSMVVGNTATKNIITKSLVAGSFPKFSINSGDTGTGKSTCAEISALRLVCESPNGEEPCCQCPKCKAGIAAILGKGTSQNIKKINLARMDSNELENLNTKMFDLEIGDSTKVYILEEAQVLKKYPLQQISLLEEIERLQEGVYIIMCTTSIKSLDSALVGRSIVFNFQNLVSKEASLLIDLTCSRLGLDNVNQNTKRMIAAKSRGCPRKIVNLLSFVSKSNLTEDDVSKWLGGISPNLMRNTIKLAKDLSGYLDVIETCLNSTSSYEVVSSFKSYFLEMAFLSEDLSYRETYLGPKDKELAKEIGLNCFLNIYEVLTHLKSYSKEDVEFTFIKIAGLIRKSLGVTKINKSETLRESKMFSESTDKSSKSSYNKISKEYLNK